ncbi:MAG: HlyD family secretion protein [Xanthobacteraceae bacterium]|jgi:RND family efflux transporter MFP subunit|nr:HlyD family secretion protein [Xanthobacteraceae bacterium]MBV9235484.1 HlyD family secretion protein [Xanthobacteraceae bacterium]
MIRRLLLFFVRFAITAVAVAIAAVVCWQLWVYYMLSPWTRDGRVRADVVPVAADVSGLVSDVFVHDNQRVKKGEPLFRIDQKRFELALETAKAQVASRQATLDQGQRDLARSKALATVAVTAQKYEQDQSAVAIQQAALDQALADLNVAKLNLDRSNVTAPVNGIVTNFGLLPGRYVTAGAPIMAIIDSDTFRVEGYFEETKLRNVHVGDRASVRLIGDPRVLTGHVESIASGIEDQSRSTSNDLLASVNPTFNWVRLAQRVPVRIKLDELPDDSRLVTGRTATVFVGDARFLFR